MLALLRDAGGRTPADAWFCSADRVAAQQPAAGGHPAVRHRAGRLWLGDTVGCSLLRACQVPRHHPEQRLHPPSPQGSTSTDINRGGPNTLAYYSGLCVFWVQP